MNPKDDKEYEVCVVCGEFTNVQRGTDVRDRKTYVIGCGQLCEKCCKEIYHTDDVRFMMNEY